MVPAIPALPTSSRTPLHVATVLTLLGVVVLAGAVLRIYHLDGRTLRQGEIFVPGIALPDQVSDPHAMLTLGSTLTGTTWDVHPPTWFLGMWFWTKMFGTSVFMMRLPSALFGILTILLTYRLATLETDRATGLLAAAFLAFNGHHILWSQVARQYTVTCWVGLASTICLVLATRAGPHQKIWERLYAAAALLGLYLLYYFWPLFLTHLLWALIATWRQRGPGRGLLRLQFLVLTLALPVVTLAVFQSRPSYLGDDGLGFFADFVRFAFLFEPDSPATAPLSNGASLAFLLLSGMLLAVGVFMLATKPASQSQSADVTGPSMTVLTVVAVLMSGVVLAVSLVLRRAMPDKATALLATTILPAVALGAAIVLTRGARGGGSQARTLTGQRRGTPSVAGMLVIVPATVVALISLAVPFFASKGMLLYTPYLLIAMATGVWSIARVSKTGAGAAVAILAVLVPAHVESIRYQAQRTGSPQDYRGLGDIWGRELRDRDMIFADRGWETTPVFYYLDLPRYSFVGRDFATAISRANPSRVWVLLPEKLPVPEAMADALRDFERTETLRVPRLRVELYSKAEPH